MSSHYNIDRFENKSSRLSPLYISSNQYQSDWKSIPHTHHFTELFYVISGSGSFIVDRKTFPVKPDDLVIVNPNVEHTEISSPSDPLHYIVLSVQDFIFTPTSGTTNHHYCHDNYRDYKQDVFFYLEALLSEMNAKQPGYEIICQNLLEILIINIERRTEYAMSFLPSKHIPKECALVKRYIDNHFKEHITLDLLAGLSHMNKYYLVHTFKKHMGISPINYLIQRRIDESKLLLETTDMSIGEISITLGFSSQSYFSQSFKAITNQSPSEYRSHTTIPTTID